MASEALRTGTLYFLALVIALSLHEFSHALAALSLGDTTAKDRGRFTLNPVAHLDPLGTLLLLFLAFQGVGIGWARPVPVDPSHLRGNMRRSMGVVALAGPFSNLLQAVIGFNLYLAFAVFIVPHLAVGNQGVALAADFLEVFVRVNLSLAAFNLIPLYPLDGAKVLSAVLPGDWSRRLDVFFLRVGMWPLVLVVLWDWILPVRGPLSWILGPVLQFLLRLVAYTGFWAGT